MTARRTGAAFAGKSVSVIVPREVGAGKVQVQIDGENRTLLDLSTTGTRLAKQIVYNVVGLTAGKHTIEIVNRVPGLVSMDVIIILERNNEY